MRKVSCILHYLFYKTGLELQLVRVFNIQSNLLTIKSIKVKRY